MLCSGLKAALLISNNNKRNNTSVNEDNISNNVGHFDTNSDIDTFDD